MEQPGLGVQAGRGRVVGHPDFGPDCRQFVERSRFCAVGVYRGQETDPPTLLDVTAQRREHGSNSAPTDKRDQQINAQR
jgi:hypothetical protein